MSAFHQPHPTVIDRRSLEEARCDCAAVVKQEFDRLLPHAREH